MGLRKPESTVEVIVKPAETAAPTNGTAAAVSRLKASTAKATTTTAAPAQANGYKQRDFDAEARGKTRCVQFEAALQSPALAGLPFKNLQEYLKLVREAAEAGVKFTFNEQ